MNAYGHETYNKGQRLYRRRIGDAQADQAPAGYMAGFTVLSASATFHDGATTIRPSASKTSITKVST